MSSQALPWFEISADAQDGRTVVTASGELDLATVEKFLDAVRHELAKGPVVLDLGDLTFIDSSGVHALDALLRDGGSLTLRAALQDNVRQVLRLTGMIDKLPFQEATESRS